MVLRRSRVPGLLSAREQNLQPCVVEAMYIAISRDPDSGYRSRSVIFPLGPAWDGVLSSNLNWRCEGAKASRMVQHCVLDLKAAEICSHGWTTVPR